MGFQSFLCSFIYLFVFGLLVFNPILVPFSTLSLPCKLLLKCYTFVLFSGVLMAGAGLLLLSVKVSGPNCSNFILDHSI